MRSLLLIAIFAASLAFTYGQDGNCKLENCSENSECEALKGPCTRCKPRRDGEGGKCVKPMPCERQECDSNEDCEIDEEEEENPCPVCKDTPKGSFCRPEGGCKKMRCKSDDDCDAESDCPVCNRRGKRPGMCSPRN